MRCTPSLSFVVACFMVCGIATDAFAANACSLVTQQKAAAIFGAPVQAGVEHDQTAFSTECIFAGTGQFSIGVLDLKAMGIPPATYGSMFEPKQGYTNTPVAGLGQQAVFSTIAAPADSMLSILSGSKILVLDATGSKNPNIRAALIDAAKQLLGKL
jgi:hypothetical protein